MSTKAVISAIALVASIGLAPAAWAQSPMIGGQAVPEDQRAAVQARCDELRAAGTTTAPATTEPAPATTEPAPATTEPAPATTEDPTEVPPTDTPVATQGGAPNDVSPPIDLANLTLAQCDEGGFTASSAMGSQPASGPRNIGGLAVPDDQLGAVQARCDELRMAGSTTPTPAAPTTTEDPTEVPPTDTPVATQGGAPNDVTPPIDLAALTLEQCDEGGFSAPAQ